MQKRENKVKLRCPHCRSKISKKAIDALGNYVTCPRCQFSFDLEETTEDLFSDDSSVAGTFNEFYGIDIPQEITKYPPAGASLQQNDGGVAIKVPLRAWASGLFLAFFAAAWSVGIMTVTKEIVWGVMHLEVPGLLLLFLLPFWLVGIFVGVHALIMLFGKVVVVIGRESYVFTGIGSLGRKKRFDWSAVENVYAKTISSRSSEGHIAQIRYLFLDGSRRMKFGGMLSGEKQSYILEILNYLHANRDQAGATN